MLFEGARLSKNMTSPKTEPKTDAAGCAAPMNTTTIYWENAWPVAQPARQALLIPRLNRYVNIQCQRRS